MKKNIFNNKTVLVTGHTGFKGSWLSLWLNHLGANVAGLSNKVPTNPSHYEIIKDCFSQDERIDIKDSVSVNRLVNKIKPKAIKAWISKVFEIKIEFFSL